MLDRGKLKLENVIDVSKYSDAEKLYRITAFVMRFINNLCVKSKQRPGILLLKNLSAKEISKAEQLWIKECQRHIQGTRNYVNLQRKLKLFEDHNGIIRCRGRLANAELPYDTKYPIFLPREKYLAVLMVRAAHERVFHGKTNQTLVELRQRFWITRGRTFVKKILHKCNICRRLDALSYKSPPTADLPRFRVAGNQALRTWLVIYVDLCTVEPRTMEQARYT